MIMLRLLLSLLLIVGTTMVVYAHSPITIDGANTGGEWAGTPPASEREGVINGGEFIWNDPAGDERTDFATPDPRADMIEVRITGDATNLYLFVQMNDIDQATGNGAPQVILSIDTDQDPSDTGQSVIPSFSDTNVGDARAYWERCMRTNFGSGTPVNTLFDDSFGEVANTDNAIGSGAGGIIETLIPWADMGISLPATLRFTVSSYRATDTNDTWGIGDGSISNALDAVTPIPGNTWNEVSDQDIDFYFTLDFDAAGDVAGGVIDSPPMITSVNAFGSAVVVVYSEDIDAATPGSVTLAPQQDPGTPAQSGVSVSGATVTYSLDEALVPDVLYDLSITGAADLGGQTAAPDSRTVRAGLDAALTMTFELDTATISGVTRAFVTGSVAPLEWGAVNELPTLNGSVWSGDVTFPAGASTRGEYKYWSDAPLFSDYGYEDFGGNRILILHDDGSGTQGLGAPDVVNSLLVDSAVDVVFSLDLRSVTNVLNVYLGFANVGSTGLPYFETNINGEPIPSGQPMNDLGVDGDAVAGDGFYSATVSFTAGMPSDIEYKYILFNGSRYITGAESPDYGAGNFFDRVSDTVTGYTKTDPYLGSVTELPFVTGIGSGVWEIYE